MGDHAVITVLTLTLMSSMRLISAVTLTTLENAVITLLTLTLISAVTLTTLEKSPRLLGLNTTEIREACECGGREGRGREGRGNIYLSTWPASEAEEGRGREGRGGVYIY